MLKLIPHIGIFILPLAVFLNTCSQNELPDNVLAQVGEHHITTEDFKRAYLPVLLYSDKKETPETREEILNFLVDQTLLAQEARSLELDTIPTLKVLKRTAEKTAFTRIFYKEWVKELIPTPSEIELRTAFQRSHHSRLVRHLFFKDHSIASDFHRQLSQGANWDSLALLSFDDRSLAAGGGVLGWMRFGDMDEDFEDAAYKLELHEVSKPVRTKFGWHIIRVDEESKELMLTEYDYSLERRQVRRVIRERHEHRLADSVANSMMAKANLVFSPEIAPKVWTIMRRQVRRILDAPGLNEQVAPEISNFEEQLTPLLDEEMLRFNGTTWTVKTFLAKLPEMNRQMMLTDLKQATAFLVRDEIIHERGLQEKLDQRKDVKGEVKDRENQFLATLYLNYQAESQPFSEVAIKTYYERHATNKYQAADSIYIHELSFSGVDQANEAKAKLLAGTSFKHIMQSSGLLSHTPLGWFQGARADRADYYHRLVSLPINTPLGPFQQNGKMTLIVATQRQRHVKPFETVREQVNYDADDDRLSKLRLNEVKKLSADKTIRMNLEKLHDLGWID